MHSHRLQLATELKDVILLNVILKMVFANERRAGWKVGREPGDGIRGGLSGKRRRQELEEEEARAGRGGGRSWKRRRQELKEEEARAGGDSRENDNG